VFTREIIQGDIAISKDLIVGIGSYEGINEIGQIDYYGILRNA